MKITVLVGLPGSGKTTLGKNMEFKDENVTYLDDISVIGGIDELSDAINQGFENIVISDVFLCKENDRETANKWFQQNAKDYEIEWIYFENEPEKCKVNAKRKNDNREIMDLIDQLTKVYKIPDGVQIRKVYEAVPVETNLEGTIYHDGNNFEIYVEENLVTTIQEENLHRFFAENVIEEIKLIPQGEQMGIKLFFVLEGIL